MSEWVTIAILGRPRGNRGELQALSLSDSPGRWESLSRVFLFRDEQALGEFKAENVWWHGGRLILKWVGIDSISAAEQLQGAEVRVPFEERAPLGTGEYFQSDLIGCELIDRASGEPLGTVTGWEELGGPVPSAGLMEIDGDWLAPFSPAICREVDLSGRRIVVDLPVGLKEVNRP